MSKKNNISITPPNTTFPKDWKILPLSALGTFSKGKGILKDQVLESGLPCVRYGEIYTRHEYIIKEFHSFISKEVAEESQEIKKNVILFAGSGETLEEIGKAVAYIGSETAYAGGDVIILKLNAGIDPIYLSYALNSDFVNWQKRRFGQGHSVVHIYSSDLANLHVPCAPLPEQKKIAEILSLWDTAIEITEKLSAKKEPRSVGQLQIQKRGLMQVLLTGKKRVKIK